ncbi:MAG: VOC family protein [Chitinophagaceae bacterium]|nr:VOC family protein [Chitinophagaceae bacterium]
MASVSTYLNFARNTEEAFNFYKSVFGGEFFGDGIMRMGDIPPMDGQPPLAEEDKNLVMHVELKILGVHSLMGTDAPESMGFTMNFGNNSYINLQPDTRAETKKLFDALSAGGQVTMNLEDMFWGDYFGSCTDKFGVQWMFNCCEKK